MGVIINSSFVRQSTLDDLFHGPGSSYISNVIRSTISKESKAALDEIFLVIHEAEIITNERSRF